MMNRMYCKHDDDNDDDNDDNNDDYNVVSNLLKFLEFDKDCC